MAIIPGSNFRFKGKKYLDDRQYVRYKSDLLNWSEPLPDGFEVYCEEAIQWYTYDWRYESSETGHFKIRGEKEASGNSQDIYDIPIYRESVAQSLGKVDCITIPDIDGVVGEAKLFPVKNRGSYAEILFSAVRELQKEVAKLRNSFLYGIESYTGKNTGMSAVGSDLENQIEEEPLWAIEEDGLSMITDQLSSSNVLFEPKDNVEVIKDGTTPYSYYRFKDQTLWTAEQAIVDAQESKIFCYLTSSSLDFIVSLLSGSKTLQIDFSRFKLKRIPESNIYNILIVVSRKQIVADNQCGHNFIWLSIQDPVSDTTLLEGYFDGINISSTPKYIDNRYSFNSILFNQLDLTKFIFYSKYQDFSNEVIPSKPNDETYKYKTAHLTIRAVSTVEELQQIKNQILNNELVIIEKTKQLWTKINNKLTPLSGISSDIPGGDFDDDTMTTEELINALKDMGIIYDTNNGIQITDLNLGDIIFIHQATGKRFRFYVNENGQLESQEVPDESLNFNTRVAESGVDLQDSIRGFIAQLRMQEDGKADSLDKDAGLSSDRLKIGSFYTPLSTDIVRGCSHSYVELENTSDQDYSLEGCQLHFTNADKEGNQNVYTLPLTGVIPAGGTYLIRGAQHAKYDEPNTFIKVKTYDQEWYVNGKLLSFEIDVDAVAPNDRGCGFALTYNKPQLSYNEDLFYKNDFTSIYTDKTVYPYRVTKYLIDSIYSYSCVNNSSNKGYWALVAAPITNNSIYRNTFMLDPAKQAFQAFTTKDSSRARWANVSNDMQIVQLDKEYIEFPHTEQKYAVSNYTPKASFEGKNVSTGKTKLDKNKPNMVTCSFGIDIYNTRCFNWVSSGYFDEYIWIKKSSDSVYNKFESYKKGNLDNQTSGVYARKIFSQNIMDAIYNRITGVFPGDGSFYTSHKAIITNLSNNITQPTEFTYIVGRADKNGNPDIEHCSDEMHFTVYPNNYPVKIYQITDQQGFHWIEYQVWAAAANKLNEVINQEKDTYLPILINTGDMTQNGTRINEWLDYYNAGKCLFNHLEQMNVVGNNDLCNTDPSILGTGDDPGKSNPYYFHVFYCYEINPDIFVPIINNKYIPSLYYFDTTNYRILMINSEITETTCSKWFQKTHNGQTVNIYTGFTIPTSGSGQTFVNDFDTIYKMIYNTLSSSSGKGVIAVCHESPFTVITNDSLLNNYKGYSRSISNTKTLVGSHLNMISKNENAGEGKNTYKGLYWFSRLMEHFGVKLVLCGHKHTYSCTYPVRENYTYTLDGVQKNSLQDGPMKMEESLQNDTANFILSNSSDGSKFPIVDIDLGQPEDGSSYFFPYQKEDDTVTANKVTYFMCQATGYKLTSNKELPSANQKFSKVLPITIVENGKDKAAASQKYPMFLTVNLSNTTIPEYAIQLAKFDGILGEKQAFNQTTFSTDDVKIFHMDFNDGTGAWITNVDEDGNEVIGENQSINLIIK